MIGLRLKHVKGASERIQNSPYVVQEVELYKRKMNTLFPNHNPLHIEVGMGKGKFIIENAKKNPMINYIGIEKYDSVIVRAVEHLENETLENVKLLCQDATYIDSFFGKEVDTIYLNFSDPWPKDRHAKRRLTSDVFLKRYDTIFKKGKHIILKTDNRHLFEYSLKSFTDYGYAIKDISLSLYQDPEREPIATEYEEKFHKKGFPIYMVEVFKT